VRPPFDDSPEFRRLLDDAPALDIPRIALEIARDAYPGLDPKPYLDRLEEMAARARERCARVDQPRKVIAQINWVLFVEEGFTGNSEEYYDPRNSYLNDVLDRKTGIPISLSLVYWRLAERLGLAVSGVNLPAHFMLRVGQGSDTLFIDAFHAGTVLDRAGCEKQLTGILDRPVSLTELQLAPCDPEEVVARVLRNLKAIHLQNDDYSAALPVQRRLAAMNPDELRDLGMLHLRLNHPAEAIAPLETYLDAHPDDPNAEDLRSLLGAARREVAGWN
jgi:regulator of sirC expression with transglutaminase-like and TPR domain